jgi:tRNA1Val (adenine37-N6)-methyltransferase
MNNYFKFKQFTIYHDKCAMKVGTDGVLLGAWANVQNATSILDVGTGTGIIAIMLAQRSEAIVDAIEIEQNACIQATENIDNCPWKSRISVKHQSFQDFSENCLTKYDLIVSNPPYFVNSLKAPEKERSTARHSDTLSHNDLLKYSADLLQNDGLLSVIMPYAEGCVLIAEAIKYGLYCIRKCAIKPLPHLPEKRLLLEFSKTPAFCNEELLTIESGTPKHYTEKYKELTRDFYLKF